MELRDQVVDKGGIALVRLLQHRTLRACLFSCIVFAILSTLLQLFLILKCLVYLRNVIPTLEIEIGQRLGTVQTFLYIEMF